MLVSRLGIVDGLVIGSVAVEFYTVDLAQPSQSRLLMQVSSTATPKNTHDQPGAASYPAGTNTVELAGTYFVQSRIKPPTLIDARLQLSAGVLDPFQSCQLLLILPWFLKGNHQQSHWLDAECD